MIDEVAERQSTLQSMDCADIFCVLEKLKATLYPGRANAIESEQMRDKVCAVFHAQQVLLVDQICGAPPQTLGGLAAVARAVVACSPHLVDVEPAATIDDRLLGVLLGQLACIK
jgi:hypothetical protein